MSVRYAQVACVGLGRGFGEGEGGALRGGYPCNSYLSADQGLHLHGQDNSPNFATPSPEITIPTQKSW